MSLVDFLTEAAALGEAGPAARWLAQHHRTAPAEHNGLCMGEDGRDIEAAGALDIHKERVRRLNQTLELVFALLIGRARVQEILHLRSEGKGQCSAK